MTSASEYGRESLAAREGENVLECWRTILDGFYADGGVHLLTAGSAGGSLQIAIRPSLLSAIYAAIA